MTFGKDKGLGHRVHTPEQEIIALVAQGYSNKEIAKHLGISLQTVEKQLANIFAKLGPTGGVLPRK